MQLYEITATYRQLHELAEEMGPEAAEQFGSYLASLQDRLEDKVDGLCAVIAGIKSDVDGLRAEEQRLAERRRSLEGRVKKIRDYMATCFADLETQKVKTARWTVSVRRSPKCSIVDESIIPGDYLVPQPPKLNRAQILSDLKAGNEVEGATLDYSESITIR